MAISLWQRRIHRAKDLAGQHPFAAEILDFYTHVASFQEELQKRLSAVLEPAVPAVDRELGASELSQLSERFQSFLSMAEARGPQRLAELSRELCTRGGNLWSELLNKSWSSLSAPDAEGLLAQAFLQPYAELLRSRALPRPSSTAHALCPFCHRKPGFGVLRPMGDGGARSMVCSFCLAEWEFRRIVCPGCGEEDEKKLAVFTASDFDYIRVECCDACKTYIKTIDLTKNGRAEPLVDELASAPLDLWAHERSYTKLQNNLFGM